MIHVLPELRHPLRHGGFLEQGGERVYERLGGVVAVAVVAHLDVLLQSAEDDVARLEVIAQPLFVAGDVGWQGVGSRVWGFWVGEDAVDIVVGEDEVEPLFPEAEIGGEVESVGGCEFWVY